ncbi:MAG TPA: NfeD family protein [Pyrinomonadaceae bacterium]|nr:NfeD family protein [Pyrinomonadaceae bacterium]
MNTLAAVTLAVALLPALALAAYVALASRHRKAGSQPLAPVGRVGSVERELDPEGFVLVGGELWRARLSGGGRLGRGRQNVLVVGARGCVLEVEERAP